MPASEKRKKYRKQAKKMGTNRWGQVSPKNFKKGKARRMQRAANRRARGLSTKKFDAKFGRDALGADSDIQDVANRRYRSYKRRGDKLNKRQTARRIGKTAKRDKATVRKPVDYKPPSDVDFGLMNIDPGDVQWTEGAGADTGANEGAVDTIPVPGQEVTQGMGPGWASAGGMMQTQPAGTVDQTPALTLTPGQYDALMGLLGGKVPARRL